MTHRYRTAVALAFFGLSLVPSSVRAGVNEWTSTGPSSRVWALAGDWSGAGTLFAATADGIYRSSDRGSSWELINNELREIASLAIDTAAGGTLYAGGRGGVVFRSTDFGKTWSELGAGLPFGNVNRLLADPSQPGTLYAAVHDWGLFMSVNRGSTWIQIGEGLFSGSLSLAIDPQETQRVFVGDLRGRVFRTDDRGATWTLAASGLSGHPVTSLAIDPLEPSVIYASTYHGGIFKSEDSGESWHGVSTGLLSYAVSKLVLDPSSPSVLYAVVQGGVSIGPYPMPWVGGIFRSTDRAATWEGLNFGLPPTPINDLAIDSSGTFLLAAPSDQTGSFAYEILAIRAPVIRVPPRRLGVGFPFRSP